MTKYLIISQIALTCLVMTACATQPTQIVQKDATYEVMTQTNAGLTTVQKTSAVTETDDSKETTLNGRGFVPYLPVGLVLGSSIGKQAGFILGAEASLVWIEDNEAFWFGINADILRDFGYDAARATGGLEAGYWIFGVEANVAYSMRDGNRDMGMRIGLVSTIGVLGVFGRYSLLFDDDNTSYGEVGALIKVPIPLF